jgi:protein O-GlcNAc transferase
VNDTLLAHAVRLHQAGNLAEAARLYGSLLQKSPRNFQALYLLGFVHFQQGRFQDAVRIIREAIAVNPQAPDAFYNLGCAYQNLQLYAEAVGAFDRALLLKADYAEALINRGVALLALKRHPDAIASFDKALLLAPRDAEALANRATALFEIKRYEEAATGYAALLQAAPNFPYARGNRMLARAHACDWRGFAKDLSQLHAEIAAGNPAITPHGSTLILNSAAEQLASAQRWVADRCPETSAPLWRGESYRHEKIRIAYLSSDFYAHATAFLMAGVFETHDRDGFDVSLVSFGPDDKSDMRVRLMKASERFIDAANRSDEDIAILLRQMEIDIAVDLKGFTEGSRPGILARRPAPLQVNYLAYPGTMGAAYMDYILADDIVIPPEHRPFYSEAIAYLPGCYQANDAKRSVARQPSRAEAGLPDKGFVFACFNNNYKITPALFDIWARLLHAVDDSVLWLFKDNEAAAANLKREAAARNIAPGRLVFAPRMDLPGHLARQALADLFLDTSPCTAHTTASDALWVGLPVLTILGNSFAGRVAASLLTALDLPELVAQSLDDYETRALELARDPARLAGLRERLSTNRGTSGLFDTERATRNLESAFVAMWERYQRGERPADISVGHAKA